MRRHRFICTLERHHQRPTFYLVVELLVAKFPTNSVKARRESFV